jgi:hypothetical protein
MDGPKARFKHSVAAFGTSIFLIGGLSSADASGKQYNDLWCFDFENAQAQGSDLVGVVAEKLALQVPFCTSFLTSSTTHLLANSTENEIWIYDMKGAWEKIEFLTIP